MHHQGDCQAGKKPWTGSPARYGYRGQQQTDAGKQINRELGGSDALSAIMPQGTQDEAFHNHQANYGE
jgi:hypothetical protein